MVGVLIALNVTQYSWAVEEQHDQLVLTKIRYHTVKLLIWAPEREVLLTAPTLYKM